jgi:ectoine hydroxylase-related dioxygenase (phytanoyl-CoA dioxygenase family)
MIHKINSTRAIEKHKQKLLEDGFTIIENVFSKTDIESISKAIEQAGVFKTTPGRTNHLFAIRQFLKEVPAANLLIFTKRLNAIIKDIFNENFLVVKSIYFDKPAQSNWFVAYHQDLTISVNKKADIENYVSWTVKQNQFAVQPPVEILENNFTIRIHLDDTDESNGALRVIRASHQKGICRPESIDWSKEKEILCKVAEGGIMIMRPLLLHASGRSTNGKNRRVIHLEFSDKTLPQPLQWSEE